MKKKNLVARVAALLAPLVAPLADAQTAPAGPTAAKDETILLNPFEVTTGKDTGYVAGSSLAGGRAETPLALTPASISVMTREFLDDLNITGLEDAIKWTVSAMPGNENQNQTPFGSFGYNFRNTGSAQNYPTRTIFCSTPIPTPSTPTFRVRARPQLAALRRRGARRRLDEFHQAGPVQPAAPRVPPAGRLRRWLALAARHAVGQPLLWRAVQRPLAAQRRLA